MASAPRVGGPPPDAPDRRRLHIHGIKEMPASYDAEVAELFRDLRAASNLSENDLAGAIGTRVDVVQALEQGALYALPPWTETCRVINAYGELLNLDVRPLLRRIYAQVEAGIVELHPRAGPDLPVMHRSETVDFEFPEAAEPFAPFPTSAPEPPPWPEPQPLTPERREQPRPPQARPQQGQPPARPQRGQPLQTRPGQPYPPPPQSPMQQRPIQSPMQPPRQGQPYPGQSQPGQQYAPPPQQPRPPRPAPESSAPYSGAQPAPAPDVPLRAEKPQVPAPVAPDAKPSRRGLLKWGVMALIVSAAIFGLWLAFGDSSSPPRPTQPGSKLPEASDRVLDPDDPRSRKADRLPSP